LVCSTKLGLKIGFRLITSKGLIVVVVAGACVTGIVLNHQIFQEVIYSTSNSSSAPSISRINIGHVF
jgi:hypothetical protein